MRRRIWEQSIVKQIYGIFILLFAIFMINLVSAGITNDQVSLTMNLMSEVFIPLKTEQLEVVKALEIVHGMTLNATAYSQNLVEGVGNLQASLDEHTAAMASYANYATDRPRTRNWSNHS